MTPRDHPAEERQTGILAPTLRRAPAVRHSEMLKVVAQNRQQQKHPERRKEQLPHEVRLEAAVKLTRPPAVPTLPETP
jgi:hypothetical protein